MPLTWDSGLSAMIAKCGRIASGAGFRAAAPTIHTELHAAYKGGHRWQNRTGMLEATSDVNDAVSGYQMVFTLYVTMFYGQWVEGGSIYLGHPSRYLSIMPVIYQFLPRAIQLAAEGFFNA